MKRIISKKVYYDIEKLLGDGLTSEVYKAFRVDGQGWTKQPVALKIIKSKNDVQILKREFESLSRIRSKYCVRVLAWENLQKGPCLVLEYIEGITLSQLLASGSLDGTLIVELMAQIRLGILALHRGGVVHGDLNLKNIMINSDGVVKLIDFGVAGKEESQLVTLPFASDRRKQGEIPVEEDDFYSLKKIAGHLFEKTSFSEKPGWEKETTKASLRRRLSKTVRWIQNNGPQRTVRLKVSRKKETIPKTMAVSLAILVFWFTLLGPVSFAKSPKFFEFNLRGKNWFEYSINESPERFGPAHLKKLRKGKYRLRVVEKGRAKKWHVDLFEHRTILLKPGDNLL